MPSVRNQKIVKSLTEKFKTMKGLILTEYHGLTVEEISTLRSKLRSFNSEYVITKNTLSKIAFKDAGIKSKSSFFGPIALVVENGDVISPAKIVVEFAKMHTKLKIKAGILDGKFIDASVVEQLSTLPSREFLASALLYTLSIPIIDFVNILSANVMGFMMVLRAIARNK
jgi:large subunit ribosomal protein L10